MAELKGITRKYANLKPDWPQPGMACRDDCGNQWRRVKNTHGFGWIGDSTTFMVRDDEVTEASPDDGHVQSIIEAIANGPDLDDAATLGALGGHRYDVFLCYPERVDSPEKWAAYIPYPAGIEDNYEGTGSTPAEAIIRAALAALGE